MAQVVVGHALDVAEAQRQQRLGAFERLDLAFLVETQDQRLVGGFKYSPTTSRSFSMKNGSVDSLKLSRRWGWSPNACRSDARWSWRCWSRRPSRARSMGGAILGPGVQGRVEQLRDALVVDRARLARAQLVMQALDAAGDEAPAPLAHGRVGGPEPLCHRAVGRTRGTSQTMVARRTNAAGNDRDRAIDATAPAPPRSTPAPLRSSSIEAGGRWREGGRSRADYASFRRGGQGRESDPARRGGRSRYRGLTGKPLCIVDVIQSAGRNQIHHDADVILLRATPHLPITSCPS